MKELISTNRQAWPLFNLTYIANRELYLFTYFIQLNIKS